MTSPSPSQDAFHYLLFRLHVTRNHLDTSWHDHEYFRRPPRLGAGHRMWMVKRVAAQNYATNRLHHVPRELLSHITDYLDESDFLSFRASCREMRSDLLPVMHQGHPPITRLDMIHFIARLYTERCSKMVTAELCWPATGKRPTTILCGFCLQSHARRAFDAVNLARGPYARACLGACGTFQVCPHEHFTFLQLRSVLRDSLSFQLCTDAEHPPTAPPDPQPPIIVPPSPQAAANFSHLPAMLRAGAYVPIVGGMRGSGLHSLLFFSSTASIARISEA